MKIGAPALGVMVLLAAVTIGGCGDASGRPMAQWRTPTVLPDPATAWEAGPAFAVCDFLTEHDAASVRTDPNLGATVWRLAQDSRTPRNVHDAALDLINGLGTPTDATMKLLDACRGYGWKEATR